MPRPGNNLDIKIGKSVVLRNDAICVSLDAEDDSEIENNNVSDKIDAEENNDVVENNIENENSAEKDGKNIESEEENSEWKTVPKKDRVVVDREEVRVMQSGISALSKDRSEIDRA